jgi:microcystin-dependent protein
MGQGPGLSPYTIGHMGGYETVTLSEAQLASHSHGSSFTGASATVKVSTQPGTNSTPGGRSPVLAASSDTNVKIYNNEDPGFSLNIGGGEVTGSITIDNTGGNQGHANIQPYTVINYCIALQGLYPSRS